MAERRNTGMADMLKGLREPATPPDERPPAAQSEPPTAAPAVPTTPLAASVERVRAGRPANGKRSNPEYAQFGLRLKRTTQFDATTRLRERREYADFSELVEALVARWLKNG